VINGYVGDDTLSYDGSTEGVTVKLFNGSADGRHARNDTFLNIDNLIGSDHGDKLIGDFWANKLDGAGGNDILNGGGGDDVLLGGPGLDLIAGGAGTDTFVLAGMEHGCRIVDYADGTDMLGPSGKLAFGDLTIAQAGTDTTIATDTELLATLLGATASTVDSGDFVLV